jgi:hypothetical protein
MVAIRKLVRMVGQRRFILGMVVGCRVRIHAGVTVNQGQSENKT